jgi:hypothetical protein
MGGWGGEIFPVYSWWLECWSHRYGVLFEQQSFFIEISTLLASGFPKAKERARDIKFDQGRRSQISATWFSE